MAQDITIEVNRNGVAIPNQEVIASLEMVLPSGGHDHTDQPT